MPNKPLAVRAPRENVNDETVKIGAWKVDEGRKVKAGEIVLELETSKAVLEIRAPEAGCLRRRHAEGAEVPVGEILFYLTAGPKDPLPDPAKAGPVSAAGSRFSQKAQALIDQHGIDPAAFGGTGLVRESDVRKFLAGAGGAAPAQASGAATRSEPLPRHKILEARYLSGGQNGGLASSVSVIGFTKGLRALARKREEWGASLTPVILFEAARLLRKHPVFNAFYAEERIHFYEEVNVGFAVDAERGLKVPVVRGADAKNLGAVARDMQDLILRYVDDELDAAAQSGGTFTITDLSSEGVFGIAPLINHRQCAILAVGAEVFAPGAEQGMYQLTLTFDHRLTEGRAAAAFLRDLRDRLRTYEEKAS